MSEVLASGNHDDKSPYRLGNPELPVAEHRAEIEDAIRHNPVTILVAPTGSGKTTQVPQYAREITQDGQPLFGQIVITQPRIVAARTVSERVNDEITDAGQTYSVGYYTSRERTEAPQHTRDIPFLTDGKAAVQLLHSTVDPESSTKRLLIIDEVHEWNISIEQLIAIVTERTDPKSTQYDPNLSVVIMSATIDSEGLRQHFAHVQPPVINVEVPTYEVTERTSHRSVANEALDLAANTKGKVLAFLPGKREIKNVANTIAKKQEGSANEVVVVPLHGQQNAAAQRRAFRTYSQGAVVATTNAAETSLTVPDATAVVDSGEVRVSQIRYDLLPTGTEGLYKQPASQANLFQRRGRVGRTAPGVYVLASPDGRQPAVSFADRPEYATPDIEKSRLDELVLRTLASGNRVENFRFFHQPPKEALDAAHARLYALGAMDQEGDITPRGAAMSKLPLNVESASMIVYAQERAYPTEVMQHLVDIAAIMQTGGILKRDVKMPRWIELAATDKNGDLLERRSDMLAQLEIYSKLITEINEPEWGDYDIVEYAARTVSDIRQSLADKLGMPIWVPEPVASEHVQVVSTCINLGQINQLWQKRGDHWFPVTSDTNNGYELSSSSVVRGLGNLVTGSLFTLGYGPSDEEASHSIQNVTEVTIESLVQIAQPLMTRHEDPTSVTLNAEGKPVVTVTYKLGNLVLKTHEQQVDVELRTPEAERISAHYVEQQVKALSTEVPSYDLSTIEDAIANPPSATIGLDPVSGEPVTVYKYGNGKWHSGREGAVESLKAYKKRLITAPSKAELAQKKALVKDISARLRKLQKQGNKAAKELLSIKDKKSDEWLQRAQKMLEAN